MSTYYAKGQWNFICDRCGFKKKSGEAKKEWNGLMVCRECYEPRHPQDFVRGRKDNQSVRWTRTEQADISVLTESGGFWASGFWATDFWADMWGTGSQFVTTGSVPDGTFDYEM